MALKRLGLFGGSFDPIHHGHLILARCAQEQLKLDELWFIPSAKSADGKRLSPAKDRLRWLKRALRPEPDFHVWTGELERGGVSRSIDTVRDLRAQLGDGVKIYLLLGQDQAERLSTWKESRALAKEVFFGIFSRGAKRLRKRQGYRQILLKTPTLDLSSTEIRKRAKEKLPLTGLLPESVRRDVVLHKFYR
jgi:nicotinate-nucleotide adenylyltransferase